MAIRTPTRSIIRATGLALIMSLQSSMTFAAPTVIVNNAQPQSVQTGETPANLTPSQATAANAASADQTLATQDPATDPQVAPLPNTPFLTPTNPDALANPDSLANSMQPSADQLSTANQELLSHNAKLQRDVNDLETRVNVLINERSGQLFMYGAVTVIFTLFIGLMIGWYIFDYRKRW